MPSKPAPARRPLNTHKTQSAQSRLTDTGGSSRTRMVCSLFSGFGVLAVSCSGLGATGLTMDGGEGVGALLPLVSSVMALRAPLVLLGVSRGTGGAVCTMAKNTARIKHLMSDSL